MLSLSRKVTIILRVSFVLLLIGLVSYWGGTARPGPLFVTGVIVLTGLVFLFGFVAWWLFFSPPPASDRLHSEQSEPARWLRQVVALVILLSSALFIIGGVWDEVWHRKFGGFGQDFLWPPHLMIYSSLALIALLALSGLLFLHGQGDIRRRFRREPLIGLLALVAAYLVVSLPSDQIWHQIYGLDITAWSLPHTLIVAGFVTISLMAAALQLSLVPARPWQGLRSLSPQELIVLSLITLGTSVLTQFGTTEWENITKIPTQTTNAFRQAFWNRPEWLYPVVVITIAMFTGTFALHALRHVGSASLVAILVIGLRATELTLFDGWQRMTMVSYFLLLPPMLALDLWFASQLRHSTAMRRPVIGTLLAGMIGLLIILPIISQTLVYPRINSSTLPGMLLFSLVMAVIAGWSGIRLGTWIVELSEENTLCSTSIGSPSVAY